MFGRTTARPGTPVLPSRVPPTTGCPLQMRLKSEFWVKAYIRRCAVNGAPAVVARHGDDDAGTIYIKVSRLDGSSHIFGPAPAGHLDADFDRRWTACLNGKLVSEAEAAHFLERETRIDSDLWIVEVEDRHGRNFLGDDLISLK